MACRFESGHRHMCGLREVGGFLCALKLERRNAQSASFTRRAFPPLSTGPSLKTERFQRGRSCGTGGNPVRGAPARLHRRKLLVKGGSGGRRAAWKPRRPPAAFGSFPLRERNSCVRRRTKLPQAAHSSPVRAPPIHDPKQNIPCPLCSIPNEKLPPFQRELLLLL